MYKKGILSARRILFLALTRHGKCLKSHRVQNHPVERPHSGMPRAAPKPQPIPDELISSISDVGALLSILPRYVTLPNCACHTCCHANC